MIMVIFGALRVEAKTSVEYRAIVAAVGVSVVPKKQVVKVVIVPKSNRASVREVESAREDGGAVNQSRNASCLIRKV